MLLAFVLAMQAASAREASPVLQFPTPGLDDPAAYEGYTARLYRDSRGNAVEIYIEGRSGRVVHLWADALNESIGFTVRRAADEAAADTAAANAAAAIAFGEEKASVWSTGSRRSFLYSLTIPGGRPTQIGQFLLGSMRVERDFGYAGRVKDPIDAPTFVPEEFKQLAERLDSVYSKRLTPTFSLTPGTWRIRVSQPSLDGKNNLSLTLTGDARLSRASVHDRVVTVRPHGQGPLTIAVEITTDGPPLTPLTRNQIFNTAFRRFADSAQSQRLEREIRGFELLSSKQKLMAGLPTYATYFGRDMLMTALLMEPVWADTMAEFVMGAALAKLSPDGDVSHEEALGGQAIRENGAEFLKTGNKALLTNLQATRENYWMVDDDFQLPVVAGRYFADASVPNARKKRFVARWGSALRRNLAYVARQAAPYAQGATQDPKHLVSFKRDPNGWCHPGSWRDSRVGYAGGCFAFDVNVVWVPAALRAIGTIDSALRAMGEPPIDSATEIAQSANGWRNTARHFMVALPPAEVETRVRAKLGSLPPVERAHWDSVLARTGLPTDTLRFPSVSLDSAGQPIPVMSTDPAMWLLLERQDSAREAELLRPFLLPYPVGLFIEGVGLAVANDAYASPAVWDMFERDLYHSPRVVWGREVNVLLASLATRNRPGAVDSVRTAVARSGLQYAELWSYKFESGALRPVRYGSSSDVQLWTLTDLAVQYLLTSATRRQAQ
jgi:hypothetical protein